MNKYAVVLNGVVINIVVWDGESDWSPEVGETVECDDAVSIGWTYDGSLFSDPKLLDPPPKSELYKKEFELMNKKYLSDVDSLSTAWGNAGLFDGSTEATKKATLQAQANSVKSAYQASISALKIKYGV
ncbi:hypothetical protein V2A85_12710 [Yersinia sp. 1252 StPb PI]|uniref:hypothetical protein n=1 Tax=Yersinia sp. 1252 StPb PI TaxID=3117404 RepID=UPI003B27F284